MQSPYAQWAPAESARVGHVWKRVRQMEEELDTVVYVRKCEGCGRVEAKAGHQNPLEPGGWEFIEG
jgi:hypothetical protein